MNVMIKQEDFEWLLTFAPTTEETIKLLTRTRNFSDDEIKFMLKGITTAYRHPRECELNKGQNIDCTIDCMCPPKEKIIEKLKRVGK